MSAAEQSGMAVALVTGSAQGIGRSVAAGLARLGMRVHVVWRRDARDLEQGFQGRVHQADLLVSGAAQRLVEEVLELDGRLDVLVHAVGEYRCGPLEELETEDVRALVESNWLSAVGLVQAAPPALRASHGRMLFFGTAGLASLRARRQTAAYAAAKTALLVWARSLALEEAAHGVRVNLISPGLVPHPGASADTRDAERLDRIPLGRGATTEEIASVVEWFCSPDSAQITGQDLEVAGGWLL
jgi:3-oxoacyl-[acyl-carrier protein] reductase